MNIHSKNRQNKRLAKFRKCLKFYAAQDRQAKVYRIKLAIVRSI